LNFSLLTNRISRAGWPRNSSAGSARSRAARSFAICPSRCGGFFFFFFFFFSDLDLSEAKKKTHFTEACTIAYQSRHEYSPSRTAKRPIDPGAKVLVSPCDAIIGRLRHGSADTTLHQIKGFAYTLDDLMCDPRSWSNLHRNGCYVTLRLTSKHVSITDFHCAGMTAGWSRWTYISGDNLERQYPIALRRVERLFFAKNETAPVLRTTPQRHRSTS